MFYPLCCCRTVQHSLTWKHTHFGVWPRSEAIVAGKRDVSWQMCWFVLLQVRAVQPLWKYGWTDPSSQLGWPRKQTWIASRPSMSARVLVWVVISCCTPWNFSRYYLEAGGRLYNSIWSSQLAAINHAAALALSWDLFCLSSSTELETKLWDPTLTDFPICLFNKCYLESSPFWEFVVVVNRMSECSVSWGWEGAWKGTKAHGIGTEMGISPGNSRNCNRLTENGYWLLACFHLALPPWTVSGLLPKCRVSVAQRGMFYTVSPWALLLWKLSFRSEGSKRVSARCQTQAQSCKLAWNASASLPVEGELCTCVAPALLMHFTSKSLR